MSPHYRGHDSAQGDTNRLPILPAQGAEWYTDSGASGLIVEGCVNGALADRHPRCVGRPKPGPRRASGEISRDFEVLPNRPNVADQRQFRFGIDVG